MDLIERYNRELKGYRFKTNYEFVGNNDVLYTFGDYIKDNTINISWFNGTLTVTSYQNLDDVLNSINSGEWILYKNDARKKKLKILINGHIRKIQS